MKTDETKANAEIASTDKDQKHIAQQNYEKNQENNKTEETIKTSKEDKSHIFVLRTTSSREDQVFDFVTAKVEKDKLDVRSVVFPHGMKGYIFIEAGTRQDAERASYGVPYARGLLKSEVSIEDIENMLIEEKHEYNVNKNDIVEIIVGPFKREKAKVMRVDNTKGEVVVELLDVARAIPIVLKIDAVKVIRREKE